MDEIFCSEFDYNYAEQPTNLNNGQVFFIMLSLLPIMLFFPVWFVAFFIHKPMVEKFNKEIEDFEEEEEKQEEIYTEKYKLDDVTNDNTETINCDKNSVLETTPEGAVLMKYSKTNDGFNYWADNQICYKNLEVVARKFVTVFQCKDLYIDQKKHMEEKLGKLKKEIEENKRKIELKENATTESDENNDSDSDDDVFAKLKSNKNTKNNLKVKLTKDDYTPEIGTKFIRKGKMADSLLEKKEKKPEKPVKNVNFSDWKSLFGFGKSKETCEEPDVNKDELNNKEKGEEPDVNKDELNNKQVDDINVGNPKDDTKDMSNSMKNEDIKDDEEEKENADKYEDYYIYNGKSYTD